MAVGYDYELYVDGARVFYDDVRFRIEITDTQFIEMAGATSGSYTYAEGQYLGWTTTQGGTTPTYEVGDIFQVNGKVYLFSIPAAAPTGSMYLGTSTISKMYLGQNEVSKVYLGQDLVYEKQASGGTISLRGVGHQDEQADSYYSYIKINEAPTTAQDYDYMITGRGYVNSKTQTQITQPVIIGGASVVYLWCDYNANFTCQYKVDNGSYQNLTPFSSPTTLTLTNDIELTLTGWRD